MSDKDDYSKDSLVVLRNVNPRTKDSAAKIHVDFAGRLFIGTDEPMEDEPYYFPVLPHVDDWERTGEYVGELGSLKTLMFGTLDGVPKEHLAALCKGGLHCNKSIKRFSIERGDFLGGRGFLALSSYFRTSTLESMHLINCEVAAIKADDFAVHLAGALSKFSSLKSFESHLNPKMAHKVLASLAEHKGLEKLHLRSPVALGKKASSALSAMLRGKSKLSSLELRYDGRNYMFGKLSAARGMLDDDGIAALSSDLSGKNAVMDLALVGNNGTIGRRGWSAFSAALKSSRSVLEKLSMPRNSIDDAGATLIATALSKNNVLRDIDLSHCRGITSRGWRAFCGVFESEDSALERMNLWQCRIDEDVHLAWANSLADNSSLKELHIYLQQAGKSAFQRILCNTSSIRDTFLSNHTLEEAPTITLPLNLSEMDRLLKINKESNTKFDAARTKIILHHSTDCLRIFKGMDTGLLPDALAWMGRRTAGSDDGPDEESRFERGSSVLYDFVRAMPGMPSYSLRAHSCWRGEGTDRQTSRSTAAVAVGSCINGSTVTASSLEAVWLTSLARRQ